MKNKKNTGPKATNWKTIYKPYDKREKKESELNKINTYTYGESLV
jgi:hypothetical protein